MTVARRNDLREACLSLSVKPEQAWAAVSDPRTYPEWLVGAVEILAVDEEWPAPGTSFHHRVGVAGPLTVQDRTTVQDVDAPHLLVLEARARPLGRAHVEIEVRATPDGAEVAMREGILGRLAPLTPLTQPLALARNRRSLQQLRDHLVSGDRQP